MVKRLFTLLFLLSLLCARGEGRLRIADASRAGINALHAAALSLALSDKTAVSIDKMPPEEAKKRLASGRAELIVLDEDDLPSTRPRFCRLFAAEVLAVYVHASNPVKNLTFKEVKELFTDKRPVWSAYYPLRKTDIHRYVLSERALGAGLGESFWGTYAREVFPAGSSRELLLLAGRDTEAAGAGLLLPDLPSNVKMLRINGVLPVPSTVASGKYLLAWRYYILCRGTPTDTAAKFLKKMKTSAFAKELENFGFMAL